MKTKTVPVPAIAHDVLSRATVQGNVIVLPPGQLDRPTYEAVNKVLTAMGGKWDRKAGGHKFPFDPSDLLADALGTGKAVNRKQTLQFFETPEALAERMAELAHIGPDDLVLEPSAGHGRLVKPLLKRGARVVTVETDATNADVLRGLDVIGVHLMDFLLWAGNQRAHCAPFNAVVMNPPFAGNQDIRHIRAAFDLIQDGGRLVAIASEHGFIGKEAECVEFRAWLDRIGADVETIPAGTFNESGTSVPTRLIVARKSSASASLAA